MSFTYQIQVNEEDIIVGLVARDESSGDYHRYLGHEVNEALIKQGDKVELIRVRDKE